MPAPATVTVQRPQLVVTIGAVPAGPDLTALEALTGTGWARREGDGVWTLATPTYTDVGADASGTAAAVAVAGAAALAAHEAATDPHPGYLTETAAAAVYQPVDADLTALAALASTGLARRTGAGTWSVGTTVSVAEGGTGATTEAAARAALGLGDPLYQEQVYASTANWSSTSVTVSNLPGCTFQPEANAVYLIEVYVAYDSDSTSVGIGVGVDAGNVERGALQMMGRGASVSSGTAYYGSVTGATPQKVTATSPSAGICAPFWGWAVVRTASSPDPIKLVAASEVAATEVRILAGMAVMRVRRTA